MRDLSTARKSMVPAMATGPVPAAFGHQTSGHREISHFRWALPKAFKGAYLARSTRSCLLGASDALSQAARVTYLPHCLLVLALVFTLTMLFQPQSRWNFHRTPDSSAGASVLWSCLLSSRLLLWTRTDTVIMLDHTWRHRYWVRGDWWHH